MRRLLLNSKGGDFWDIAHLKGNGSKLVVKS